MKRIMGDVSPAGVGLLDVSSVSVSWATVRRCCVAMQVMMEDTVRPAPNGTYLRPSGTGMEHPISNMEFPISKVRREADTAILVQ